MSEDRVKRLAQLRQAYENGILDEDTYQAALAALGQGMGYEAEVASGAVAQGEGAAAVGERGVYVGGNMDGDIYTGDFQVAASIGPSPFVTARTFFRRFERRGQLFNHAWVLVGRQAYLQQIENEFLDSDQISVAILSGRGGIGKTKLLHAFSQHFEEHHPDIKLFFVVENITLSARNIEDLPDSSCLIVLDDAHRNEDVFKTLLAIAQHRNPLTTKLLLSTRPQGVNQIKSLLTRVGYDPREILSMEPLGNLEKDDLLELTRAVLSKDDEYLVEQLARATKDCPLVTVVGGQLLAQKAIPPNLLERNMEFQSVVLSRFEEEIVGEIKGIDPNLIRQLLALIASLGPVQPMTQEFQQAASEFLNISPSNLIDAITKLENAGILIRRGYALRITPDVLSDHILHEACFTSKGFSTNYAQQVFNHFASLYPSQVLRNLAELDWRVLRTTNEAPNLMSDIWQVLLAEFREASNAGRCNALRILKDVAYYQPGPMLQLVEIAIREPTKTQEPKGDYFLLYAYTHADVLSSLPEILRLIGYTLDLLPHCCDLLWELGRDDSREMHPHPYHAMRILTDLASYDVDKPITMNQIVLEAASRWLKQQNVHSYVHHPLDVVDSLLAKSGEAMRSYSDRITFHPFAISIKRTSHLREKAMQLIVDCAHSDNRRAIIRAINSLNSAIHGPFSLHRRQISDKEREQWIPERMQALNHVAEIASQTDDAIVHWHIIEVLRRHIRFALSDDFKAIAEKIIDSIPETFELRLMQVLCANSIWDWVEMPDDREVRDTVAREYQQQMASMSLDVVLQLLEQHPDAAQGVERLNDFLSPLPEYSFRLDDRQFMGVIAKHFPEYAIEMCWVLIEKPDCYLVTHFSLLLNYARDFDESKGIEIAKKAIEVGNDKLAMALSNAYRWGTFWAKEPSPVDLEIFSQLISHQNLRVRQNAIGSLQNLGNAEHRLALSLMRGIDIGDHSNLAMELVSIFDDGRWGIPYHALSNDDILVVLTKLEATPKIDEYHINIFLQYASRRLPVPTLNFLLRRVERASGSNIDYYPLPVTGFHYPLDGFGNSDSYDVLLREARDTSLQELDGVRHWLPRLFKEVSSGFHPISLTVLREWIDSGDAEKIVFAMLLLEDAPEDFVFEHEDFVIYAIEQAHAIDEESYNRATSALSRSVRFGTRSGVRGQLFSQDVTLRDKATETRTRYSLGSLGYQFYDGLVKWAEDRIHEAQHEDDSW